MISAKARRITLAVLVGMMLSFGIIWKTGLFKSFLAKKYEADTLTSSSQNPDNKQVEGNNSKSIVDKIDKKNYSDDKSLVSIVQSERKEAKEIEYDEINSMVSEAVKLAGGFEGLIKNGQVVVLKPNLVQKHVDSTGQLFDKELNGATTDWRVTKAVASLVRKYNPGGKIYVMEGSAGDSTRATMEYLNYTKSNIPEVNEFIAIEEDSGAWGDYNSPNIIKKSLPTGLLHKEYYLNKKYAECDVLISIPCLKTNSGTVVSGSVKNVGIGATPANIYGVDKTSPGRTKMVSHKVTDGELDKWLYDYYMCKPVNFVVMDGLQGFQNGPVPIGKNNVYSDRMNMRLIMAGKDSIAVDSIEALVEGWDPQGIAYLNYLAKSGMGNLDTSKIIVAGNRVDQVRKDFSIRFASLGGLKVGDKSAPKFNISKKVITENELRLSINGDDKITKVEVFVNDMLKTIALKPDLNNIKVDIAGVNKIQGQIKVCAYDRFLNYSEMLTDLSVSINERESDVIPVESPLNAQSIDSYLDRKAKLLKNKNLEGLIAMSTQNIPLNVEKNPLYYILPKGIIRLAHDTAMERFNSKDIRAAEKYAEFGLSQYAKVIIKKDLLSININDIRVNDGDPLKDSKIAQSEFILIYNNYGYFIAQTGDDKRAEAYLRKVVEFSPDRAVAYIDIGNVTWNLGKKDEAKEHYKKYLALLGNNTSKVPQSVYDRIKE